MIVELELDPDHMILFRLQTLRECVYQASTKTCTCFAGMMDHRTMDQDGKKEPVITHSVSPDLAAQLVTLPGSHYDHLATRSDGEDLQCRAEL